MQIGVYWTLKFTLLYLSETTALSIAFGNQGQKLPLVRSFLAPRAPEADYGPGLRRRGTVMAPVSKAVDHIAIQKDPNRRMTHDVDWDQWLFSTCFPVNHHCPCNPIVSSSANVSSTCYFTWIHCLGDRCTASRRACPLS